MHIFIYCICIYKLTYLCKSTLIFLGYIPLTDEDGDALPVSNAFKLEQYYFARLIHIIYNNDTDIHVLLYSTYRNCCLSTPAEASDSGSGSGSGSSGNGSSSVSQLRLPFLVPPLVYACLALVRRIYDRELDSLTFTPISIPEEQEQPLQLQQHQPQQQVQRKEGEESQHTAPITVTTAVPTAAASTTATTAPTPSTLRFSSLQLLQFILELITLFSTGHNSDLSLSLSLQAALAADECRHSIITYEFIQAAFLLYETDITNSQTQVRVLISLISTLTYCKHILYDDYEALTTKIAQYATKLLRKSDQSRCITLTTHVFIGASDERALECLQRALKVS